MLRLYVSEEPAYRCTCERHGDVIVLTSTGAFRGPRAIDTYAHTIEAALEERPASGLVSDLRAVTRLPNVRDCLNFTRRMSRHPRGASITRAAVVIRSDHPLVRGLLRVVANGSRFFPERRVYVGDTAQALAWTARAPTYRAPGAP